MQSSDAPSEGLKAMLVAMGIADEALSPPPRRIWACGCLRALLRCGES